MSQWETYHKKHEGRPPREQVVRAVELCKSKDSALDLGAGTMIETAYLLKKGFKEVVAIDSADSAKDRAVKLNKSNLKFIQTSFQDYNFPVDHFDFINSQYSLPFHGKENFTEFINKVKSSLKPGGIFVGQFFGDRDEWNGPESSMAFVTEAEAKGLLSGLEIVEISEEDEDGVTALGNNKHWHVFHFIARK